MTEAPQLRTDVFTRVMTGACLGALALVFAAAPAWAARITDVADAADERDVAGEIREDPFDLYVGTDFDFQFSNGTITREAIDQANFINESCNQDNRSNCQPVDELKWNRGRHRMRVHGQIGLFHDLSLTFSLPIYFTDRRSFDYPDGVDATNSSIDGTNVADPLFAHNFVAKHSGIGNLELGMRFGPLNDERDPSKLKWVLYFGWAMPYTADTHFPDTDPGTDANPGPMGDGVHYLTFGTSFSKRLANIGLIGIDPKVNRRGYVEPYVDFSVVVPVPESGRAPDELVKDANTLFGRKPPTVLKINAGFEFIPYEDLRNGRKFSADLGMRASLVTDGRTCGPLCDALGEYTFNEQYTTIAGYFNTYFKATEFVRFKVGVGLGYISEHYLTFENVGNDNDGNGEVRDEQGSPDEPNEFYDERYDQVGFRFKSERNTVFDITVGLQATF